MHFSENSGFTLMGGIVSRKNRKLQENSGNHPRKVQQRRRRSRPGGQSFRSNLYDEPGQKEKTHFALVDPSESS